MIPPHEAVGPVGKWETRFLRFPLSIRAVFLSFLPLFSLWKIAHLLGFSAAPDSSPPLAGSVDGRERRLLLLTRHVLDDHFSVDIDESEQTGTEVDVKTLFIDRIEGPTISRASTSLRKIRLPPILNSPVSRIRRNSKWSGHSRCLGIVPLNDRRKARRCSAGGLRASDLCGRSEL